MKLIETDFEDCYMIEPDRFGDERGYFSPYYIDKNIEHVGFRNPKQVIRKSNAKGEVNTFNPSNYHDQDKIIEVLKGSAIDLVLDNREDSITFGKTVEISLNSENHLQVLVKPGFIHTFISLEDDTVFQYLVDTRQTFKSLDPTSFGISNLNINLARILKEHNINNPIMDKNFITLKESRYIPTNLCNCSIVENERVKTKTGYISQIFNQRDYRKVKFEKVVQANRSMSSKGVLRGLHFQEDPKCQAKIVEVIKGRAIDVVVDLRRDSSTYKCYKEVLLTEDNDRQLFVPRGFAHGFISLEDNTVFQYLVDNDYAPKLEGGIPWNDPSININWERIFKEYGIENPLLSDKDTNREPLSKSKVYFRRNK